MESFSENWPLSGKGLETSSATTMYGNLEYFVSNAHPDSWAMLCGISRTTTRSLPYAARVCFDARKQLASLSTFKLFAHSWPLSSRSLELFFCMSSSTTSSDLSSYFIYDIYLLVSDKARCLASASTRNGALITSNQYVSIAVPLPVASRRACPIRLGSLSSTLHPQTSVGALCRAGPVLSSVGLLRLL